jgi:hypothetical protein
MKGRQTSDQLNHPISNDSFGEYGAVAILMPPRYNYLAPVCTSLAFRFSKLKPTEVSGCFSTSHLLLTPFFTQNSVEPTSTRY